MNHDELLILLKDYAGAAGLRMDRNSWLILADVVELHKPLKANDLLLCECAPLTYPCPTIHAILKGVE
jgi:hypothetical protein